MLDRLPPDVYMVSSRGCLRRQAKRGICFCGVFITLFLSSSSSAQNSPTRPRITDIDHVRIYVSDFEKSRQFYERLTGIRAELPTSCLDASRPCFLVGWLRYQGIELEKVPVSETKNWLAEIAFRTDDVVQMRRYLVAHGVEAGKIFKDSYDKKHPFDAHFEALDPGGTRISFVQRFLIPVDDPPPGAPWYVQLIHAGLIVHDRVASDHFYKDILGFRPYWHGGMKDEGDDWVALQVPDGTDWIEYMLNVSPNADKRELGVMNHIALGVKDIHATQQQLIKNGWKPGEEPQIGRDGKWQLNLYDPDGTRVEFMEFTPVQRPCCSDYTGPHPKP
jgi:catechol 2,3-dioxygenase-like lactoylglutathione lyase family enzyme